jgi:voltage-dependent anion channel protein 2
VAAKMAMDKDSFVKAKVDNEGFLGLSYTHSLRQGMKVAVGALFDATRLDTSAHKVGLHMTFES